MMQQTDKLHRHLFLVYMTYQFHPEVFIHHQHCNFSILIRSYCFETVRLARYLPECLFLILSGMN